MRRFIGFVLFSVLLVSCGTSKKPTTTSKVGKVASKTLSSENSGVVTKEARKIIKTAEKYLGVPYKYAGNTSSGFDCSGLVSKVFIENNKTLPRRSTDQALEGNSISVKEIKAGDLVFFATMGGAKVSHVGIVHTIETNGEIKFIHASTSKGVIISSLNETYWNKSFLFARRIL
ncbi:C40 family peptidase [Riemerella anatipestifer]|uniref:C40 family peptidase n=1 Tax=Riemerella anatipestifer TaxID=34085 RepID=UPI00129D6BB7|nr:C40 family peptidase [Riemerella anatipestifer]MRM96642.1 NlpC/P60 family protein [Riemerella anatipestifer]